MAANPCDGCDARCCGAYVIPVSGEDAFRLARATGLPLSRVVAYAPQYEATPSGFLLEPDGPTHDLLLAAQAIHPSAPCLFLTPAGRCGVYAARPRACRRFPAVRAGGGLGVRDGIVCPPGAWTRAAVDRLSFRVALLREEREWASYGAVVADWNRRVRAAGERFTPVAFLDDVEETYAWLAGWRAALRPAERSSPGYPGRLAAALAALPGR